MSIPDRFNKFDGDRRLVTLLLLLLLVLVGSGVGSMVFSGPSPPPSGNESTATVTTSTPTPTESTPGGGLPVETETATPTDRSTPTRTPAETRTRTPRDDDDDETMTPSPGIELGEDGPLLETQNLAPGASGQGSLTLRNAEDEDGVLTISAVDVTDEENGLTDPESDVDDTPDVGELSSHLEVRLLVQDSAGNEEYLIGNRSSHVTLANVSSQLPSSDYRLGSGEEVTLVADWRLPSSTGNEVQSDGVNVDVGLSLESFTDD